tara:strand:- start:35 stop:238 length:204 start_codon:yes stop_codon:yes gene_type:complete
MTTLFLFLLGGLAGTFVGEFIANKFIWNTDIPPEPKQKPKQEPIDPEDSSYWNYSKLRLKMMENLND